MALDGCKIDWDLASPTHTIWFYSVDGRVVSHISGSISQKRLEREIDQFLGEHGPEQLALFEM